MPTTDQDPRTYFALRAAMGTSQLPYRILCTEFTAKIGPLRAQPGCLSVQASSVGLSFTLSFSH